MATYSGIITGLQIFLANEGDKHGVSAEHDKISAGSTPPDKMSPEQAQRLKDAGWFWDDEVECWDHFT